MRAVIEMVPYRKPSRYPAINMVTGMVTGSYPKPAPAPKPEKGANELNLPVEVLGHLVAFAIRVSPSCQSAPPGKLKFHTDIADTKDRWLLDYDDAKDAMVLTFEKRGAIARQAKSNLHTARQAWGKAHNDLRSAMDNIAAHDKRREQRDVELAEQGRAMRVDAVKMADDARQKLVDKAAQVKRLCEERKAKVDEYQRQVEDFEVLTYVIPVKALKELNLPCLPM